MEKFPTSGKLKQYPHIEICNRASIQNSICDRGITNVSSLRPFKIEPLFTIKQETAEINSSVQTDRNSPSALADFNYQLEEVREEDGDSNNTFTVDLDYSLDFKREGEIDCAKGLSNNWKHTRFDKYHDIKVRI